MGTGVQPLAERVVLVVDDEDMVRRFVAHVLVKAGFRVLEAHNGGEALALLPTLEGAVQLVVSDVSMPGTDGETLALLIAERWPGTPVLLISGKGGPNAGYFGPFLPKPFMPRTLLDAVAALVPVARLGAY
jgi:two-component system, cell cycle sensor histidine kinase and response regulator CckA